MDAAFEQLSGADRVMSNSNLMVYGILGLVILLVIIALFVVYGRINRSRNEYDDGEDLFDQRFGGGDDPFDQQEEDFASIRITREPQYQDREPGPLVTEAEEPYEQAMSRTETVREPAENVVPLRSAEPEPQPIQRAEPVQQREPLQVAANETPGEYDYGAAGGYAGDRGNDWQRGGYDDRMSSGRGSYEDDAPFVAPFIREYIEESERRQSHRLDDLRDDMRRQLSSIREEQSSRLDLFLSSIERKLNRTSSLTGVGDEEGASLRRRIDSLSDALDRMQKVLERNGERMNDLGRMVEDRLADMATMRSELRNLHDDVLSFGNDVEQNTAAIASMREQFDLLKEDFGRLERSFLERAQNEQGVNMRLADVVSGTLDDDEYELNAKLSTGDVADCVIYLRGGRSKVVIDGSFQIDCFNRLPSRDAVRRNLPQAKAAEDEFRRTVLRSIFACADRFIINGETVDSAILFLPSEAAYTILHDRFPDLVRDSHRARVWLTSPSTLMGTLNLLHNVMPAEAGRYDDDAEEGPFYAGPADHDDEPRPIRARKDSEEDERAAAIERRLRELREEEEALAEELVRRREEAPRRRYRAAGERPRREQPEDDFETRLERFSFDLDDDGVTFEENDSRRGFKNRDDDLR
ncbi:hypothetical protein GCM10007148_02270 [Parvularcula lutaonensis]|nr:hypothetical protein GCM10007148_02270 [Parvularcula lutaonensis]